MKISKLEQQIQKLIHLHQQSLDENKQLSATNKALTEKTTYQNKLIAELEEKYKAVKLAQSIKSGGGNEELKLKIDNYIKEIDRCLTLLNNEPI